MSIDAHMDFEIHRTRLANETALAVQLAPGFESFCSSVGARRGRMGLGIRPFRNHQAAEVYEGWSTLAPHDKGPCDTAQALVCGELQVQSRSVLAPLGDCAIVGEMI